MRALLSSPLGLLIGISLGALGGGGSILAVPALVYAAGQTPKQATATSLLLVTITALTGMIPHARAGRVRPLPGAVFGLCGVGGSLLGSRLNSSVDSDVLLLAFSAVMLVAAWAMWRRLRRPTPATPRRALRYTPATIAKIAVAGSFVGLLTGFFGVGGGFVIVPALVLVLGFSMPDAVGTSLLVIAINSVVATMTRLKPGVIVWSTVVPFVVASLVGVFIGGRLATSRDSSSLQRWFVALLVVVAVYTAVDSIIALA